jgi:hypothetical protein
MIIFITQLVPTWREENHYYSELHRIPLKINNYNHMKNGTINKTYYS